MALLVTLGCVAARFVFVFSAPAPPTKRRFSGGVDFRGRVPGAEGEGGVRDRSGQRRGGGLQLHAGE